MATAAVIAELYEERESSLSFRSNADVPTYVADSAG